MQGVTFHIGGKVYIPSGDYVFEDLSDFEKETIKNRFNRELDNNPEIKSQFEAAQAAKWTIVRGHRRFASSPDSLHETKLSKTGGQVLSVRNAGYVKPVEDRTSVHYVSSFEELVSHFGGTYKSGQIYTNDPAFTIGAGGSNIKFLSLITGKSLKVISE